MENARDEKERLSARWYHDGERGNLRHEAVAVLRAIQHGEKDWESYLRELPFVDEVSNGRDLRGLDFSALKEIPGINYARDGFLDLAGANLHNADLSFANLYRIHLEDANLYSCNLSHTNLVNSHLRNAILEYVDLTGSHIEKVDLRGFNLSTVKGLNSAILKNVRLGETVVQREQFEQEDRTPMIYNEVRACWCRRGCTGSPEMMAEGIAHFDSARATYLALKNNFLTLGEHRNASWAAFKEKEMEKQALALRIRRGDFKGLLGVQKRLELLGYSFFERLFQYGENPWRLVWWALGVILTWAVLYPISGIVSTTSGGSISYASSETLIDVLRTFLTSLYLSAITFTTVGYGDFIPAGGIAHFLAGAEALLGLLFLGLFVWTLGRTVAAR